MVNKWWQNDHFRVNYPFKKQTHNVPTGERDPSPYPGHLPPPLTMSVNKAEPMNAGGEGARESKKRETQPRISVPQEENGQGWGNWEERHMNKKRKRELKGRESKNSHHLCQSLFRWMSMLVLFALPLRLPLPPSLSTALLDPQSTALFFLFLQLSHSFYPGTWYYTTPLFIQSMCVMKWERERERGGEIEREWAKEREKQQEEKG